MRTPARLGAFAALLLLVFAAATFAGAAIDPSVEEKPEPMEMDEHGAGHGSSGAGTDLGLSADSHGHRLVIHRDLLGRGAESALEFSILDSEGVAERDFDRVHERRMHLIVVRGDFQAFQHLHPKMDQNGVWRAALDASLPGEYRMYADFSSGGEAMTLSGDLFVPGRFRPRPLGTPSSEANAGGGYRVKLNSGAPAPGMASPAEFTVTLNGRPVEDLEPYLGADGHLVVLRQGDQAFLHTHPEGEPGGYGPIRFAVTYPSEGRYRLYLQFRHGGEVRTAEFTQEVGAAAGEEPASSSGASTAPEHGDQSTHSHAEGEAGDEGH